MHLASEVLLPDYFELWQKQRAFVWLSHSNLIDIDCLYLEIINIFGLAITTLTILFLYSIGIKGTCHLKVCKGCVVTGNLHNNQQMVVHCALSINLTGIDIDVLQQSNAIYTIVTKPAYDISLQYNLRQS